MARFRLVARIWSDNLSAVRPALEAEFPGLAVREADPWMDVEGRVEGPSAEELNLALVSALRRAEPATTVEAAWRAPSGRVERYVDLVSKGADAA